MSRSSSSAGSSNRAISPVASPPPRPSRPTDGCRTVFLTGTDTGVGKTLVTGLLLQFLRGAGARALAFKPFATGDRADARRLNRLQPGLLTLDEVNPFFFRLPMAPAVAAQFETDPVPLAQARAAITAVQARAEVLLVEGCGGLLAPLGRGYTLLDLMQGAELGVVVVAANRLGVLNHARLTVDRLRRLRPAHLQVALVDTQPASRADPSRATNLTVLRELLAPVPVNAIPYLGPRPWHPRRKPAPAAELARALAELARVAW